ncbi:sulfatase [Ilumatobacter sp.]|uniref:sulfatase family protein n=1 Tax=Ilumatobacter sp. TaxID=1967498 RepID=UPI003B52588C
MERRPNIVLINCDDLGYGDLGCYGSELNATPALDRLAAQGARLTDFMMASPVCSPSRGALLTGCYPPRIGFGSFDGLPVLFPGQAVGLDPGEVSIGRLLSDAGYATLMVGKWHCGDQSEFLPTNHGFDRYFGLPYSNDMGRQSGTPTTDTGEQRGYPPLPLLDDDEVIEQQPDQTSLTGRYVTEVLRFVREHRDRPFFVYLAHLYVHLPIYVQERFARQARNGRYGAAVESIDWAAEVIFAELERLGLADDTLVVFTSDNGALDRADGGSNRPLRGSKGSTWEGGMRVPCIARWPGRIEAGRVVDELATSMDLFATFAALAGAEVPPDREIDGRDLSAMLLDDGASPHESFAYWWMDDLCAVRSGRWKLHLARHGEQHEELYDLVDDLGESHDVAAAHPEVVQRLRDVAEGWRRRLGDARLGVEGAEVRRLGRVAEPRTLTTYDPDHPYYAAEYDLPDRG